MKVWMVEAYIPYEYSTVIAIFDSENKAEDFAELKRKSPEYGEEYCVEEMEVQ